MLQSRFPSLEEPLAEVRRILALAMPLVLGQFAMMGIGVADVIIAGNAGTEDLAAVTLGFHLWDLSMLLIFGIVLANSALIGNRFGAGDIDGVRRQFQQCLWLGVPLSLCSGGFIVLAMYAIGQLDVPDAVRDITLGYLQPTVATAMLVPFVICFRTTAEGLGLTRPVMWLQLAAFLLNIPLNYALVNGLCGLPPLGGAGCGWASLASVAVLTVCWVLYTVHARDMRQYRLWQGFGAPQHHRLRATLSLGLPIGLELFGVGGFFAAIPLMMAPLGPVALAGHSVAITFDMLMLMLPLGIGQAMSVRISQQIGAGRGRGARAVCSNGMLLLAAFALLQAILIVAFREPIAALFTQDPAVRELGMLLLLYAALYRVFDSAQIGASMSLRGYHDTRVASAISIVCYWCFGLPLCHTLAMGSAWTPALGVRGFWSGMVLAIMVAASLICLRLAHTSARHAKQADNELPASHPTE